MTRCTTPCSTVVRPVPSESIDTISDSASSVIPFASIPSVSGRSSTSETIATLGIVRPIVASAEPQSQVQARLQAIAPGRAVGRKAFGRQYERGDRDADHGQRQAGTAHACFERRRKAFCQQHHRDQRDK